MFQEETIAEKATQLMTETETNLEKVESVVEKAASVLIETAPEEHIKTENTLEQAIDLITNQIVVDNSDNLSILSENINASRINMNDFSSDDLTELSSDENSDRLCKYYLFKLSLLKFN